MEAPSSINWATPASTVVFAGGQLQWTTQADLHMAAAYTVASVSANATGLFTHDGGIQAVAANGPVSLQAHTDQLEILADKAVTIVSVNDVIEIKASEKIVLQAGQSSVTLEGGNITFACPGNFSVKGGQHVFESGAYVGRSIAPLPDGEVSIPSSFVSQSAMHSLRFAFAGSDAIAAAYDLVGTPFRLTNDKGDVLASGRIDETGRLPRFDFEKQTDLELHLGKDEWRTVNIVAETVADVHPIDVDDLENINHRYDGALDTSDETHLSSAFLANFITMYDGEE
jgi:type VI secretion system secreted protein VgrG